MTHSLLPATDERLASVVHFFIHSLPLSQRRCCTEQDNFPHMQKNFIEFLLCDVITFMQMSPKEINRHT